MPPFDNVFYEISAILALSTAAGAGALILRQPLIVAFIAVGIVAGPAGMEWVSATDQIDLLARMGIALLLFVVGLRLVARILTDRGVRVLAVDSDPDRVRMRTGQGFELRYGDAEDPEFVGSLPLDRVQCVVDTLRDRYVNRALLHGIERSGSRPRVVLTADTEQEAEALRARGADIALVPYSDAARDAVDRILATAEPSPVGA